MQRLSGFKRFVLGLLMINVLVGCARLPSLEHREESFALSAQASAQTSFAHVLRPLLLKHPGKSGIYPLVDAGDAFAARILLAQHAERTLDVQYYIWHLDMTGTLLFEALHEAADRGVKVRLLLDDNNTANLDEVLSVLDSHPNIQVRLFNPFVIRKPRMFGYLTDFSRANRRMHNKSFTVDNQATIVGGRNIGDEYFGAASDNLFADLDVLTVGPVVKDVSRDFDKYWSSDSAYPLQLILPPVDSVKLQQLANEASEIERNPAAAKYVQSINELDFIQQLVNQTLKMEWADVQMVSDPPTKGLGKAPRKKLLISKLTEIIGEPQQDVELVSPYFVPTKAGMRAFAALSDAGVEVQVLTNSFDATDVAVVHAGYAKWRKRLVKKGVKLYEMRRIKGWRTEKRQPGARHFLGSSGSSLHAKTFSVDGERVFVGSFNFDPRSAMLNTELGFVIKSPALASSIKDTFELEVPYSAYEVQLCNNGRLCWIELDSMGRKIHYSEPETTFLKRTGVRILSWLPIDWLL